VSRNTRIEPAAEERRAADPAPAGRDLSGRARLLALLALGAAVVAGYHAAERALLGGGWGFPLDDAWIHLAFAKNLAAGHGLAYHPGDPVAGSTAPLWTALLAPLFLLPGAPAAWAKALGAACYVALAPAAWRLARALCLGPRAALFAAVLTAATSWLAWSALSGMEVPLFTLLTVAGLALHAEERADPARPPLALGVFGLATLARPEGALLLALAVADALVVVRRGPTAEAGLRLAPPPWRRIALGLAPSLAALAAPFVWSLAATGSLLPTTFGAKAGAGVSLPDPRALYTMLGVFFQPQPWATLLAGAGALRLAVCLGGRRDRGLLPALWLAALPLAYAALSPPGRPLVGNFGRYLFPLLPVLVVLAVAGLEPAGRRLGTALGAGRLRLPLRAALAALLLAPPAAALVAGAGRFATSVANVEDGDVALARWTRDHLPPDAVLAVQDIGALGYLTDHRLVDLSGIVSPAVQDAVRAAAGPDDPAGRRGMERFLAAERPDYLIVYPRWYPEIAGDRARFRPLVAFDVPNNVTLAGDRLTVHTTPWTRHPPRPPESP
jgi:hypothetical protein